MKIKNVFKFIYRIIFVDLQYIFTNLSFWKKVKFDSNYLLGSNFNIEYIDTGDFRIFGDDALWVLYEKSGYSQIRDCNNVLDLGGYIGDSALELSKYNKNIYAFEPEKNKMKYILKNIKENTLCKRVFPFNYAVIVSQKKTDKLFVNKNIIDGSASTYFSKEKNYEKINCMNIKDVLELAKFDGIKCDIEGGEWPLIKYFLKNSFHFDKGVFEIHFFQKSKKSEIDTLKKFIKFLNSKNYELKFYKKKPSSLIDIDKFFTYLNDDMNFSSETMMMFFAKK